MRTRTPSVRAGVVLLVVIALLMLFAIVGIAFVIYAEAQASTARIWKESESQRRPDMDPEELLAYFLSQLIYDTDNPQSALRNESLARNMYGQPGSTAAYQDVAYTYPDDKNKFLAAQRASDGAVLIPSFVRQRNSLRAPGLPPVAHPSGDVKNLADSPGYQVAGNAGPNDSVWIDLGHPVMKAADGRKFKPLFATTILDQEGKLNLNAHGNTLGNIGRTGYYTVSHQGWCAGEVSIEKVLKGPNQEASNIFMGNTDTGAKGRYDQTRWQSFWGGGGWGGRSNEELKNIYAPGGHFYASTNLDCWPASGGQFVLPKLGSNFGFPYLTGAYSHGWMKRNDNVFNPSLYNYFDPRQNVYWLGSPPAEVLENRSFAPASLEALLRYGDTGSPALASDLYMLCPQSLMDGKTRRLVSILGFDLCAPGLVAGQAGPYTLPPNAPYPTGQAGPTKTQLPRIDLNRGFIDYPDINAQHQIDAAGYQTAHQNRVAMARELFEVLRNVTGASDPAAALPGSPDYDALRWLAQLAVNIVDFTQFPRARQADAQSVPPDDIMTCFNWNPRLRNDVKNGWVFGTVLPRLVINETYIEVANRQQNPAPMTANQFDVNVWVELHNPFCSDQGGGTANGHRSVPLPLDGVARLFVPGQAGGGYAAYRLIVAQAVADNDPTQDNRQELAKADNVLGQPINIKTVVDQFDADTTVTQPLVLMGDDLNQVKPNYSNGNTKIDNSRAGGNDGYYVLGPKAAFPGTDMLANFFATLPVKEQASQTGQAGAQSSMRYDYRPNNGQVDVAQLKHTIVLQRLACPYLPWQDDPGQDNYNPYVTVDYVAEAKTNDAVTVDGMGKHVPTPVDQRASDGRNQPYAADPSQQVKQDAAYDPAQLPAIADDMSTDRPKNTLFAANLQGANANAAFAYDWLVHMNRPLVSAIELLDVSGYKPHQLTQKFVQNDPAGGQKRKFGHRAPWLQADALIFRGLEYVEAGIRPQYTPIGGRFTGRININSIWDREIFEALCDQRNINFFTNAAVTSLYDAMLRSRSPAGQPQPGDQPFQPFTAASIHDTLLRPDLNAPAAHPQKRLLEPHPDPAVGEFQSAGRDHPYLRMELLNKICGNLTTRSNVFAVWVTVGFFEVDDSNQLGQEIGLEEGRHIRHRMFAIVDRSVLTLDKNQPGQAGERPFFISANEGVQPGQNTIAAPTLSGKYEELSWSIKPNMDLVIDTGVNQETVRVLAVDVVRLEITTTPFQLAHPPGFAISNATLGYPGPQPSFDPRNPKYAGVVRYFSIIE